MKYLKHRREVTQTKPGVVVIEGHVQGLANTRALGKAGIPVIVIDTADCLARSSSYCSVFYRCPEYNGEEFISFLIRLRQKEGLDNWLLLPSNDHAVYNISRHKDELLQHYQVITDDFPKIQNIYNKRKLLALAARAGVPIPDTYLYENDCFPDREIEFPVLIKGNNGLDFYKRHKAKAFLANNETELKNILSSKLKHVHESEYFIQNVIPGTNKTISVTVMAVQGIIKSYWMGIKIREHPLQFGTATCCESVVVEDLLDPASLLMEMLNYTGVCEIEFLKDPRDGIYKLIEINARTWLWVGLAITCGVNYPLQIHDFVYQKKEPETIRYQAGVRWLNIYTDLAYGVKGLLSKTYKFGELIGSYRDFTDACFDKTDPMPFLKYALLATSFRKKR